MPAFELVATATARNCVKKKRMMRKPRGKERFRYYEA